MERAAQAVLALLAVIVVSHLLMGNDRKGSNGPQYAGRWIVWLLTGKDRNPSLAAGLDATLKPRNQ